MLTISADILSTFEYLGILRTQYPIDICDYCKLPCYFPPSKQVLN